jgi:hypothetical protein
MLAFGTAAAIAIAGVLCLAFFSGVVGEVLAVVLISAGLAGAVLLVFLEIGLGEERDLAEEEERRRRRSRLARGPRLPRRPRRPN